MTQSLMNINYSNRLKNRQFVWQFFVLIYRESRGIWCATEMWVEENGALPTGPIRIQGQVKQQNLLYARVIAEVARHPLTPISIIHVHMLETDKQTNMNKKAVGR